MLSKFTRYQLLIRVICGRKTTLTDGRSSARKNSSKNKPSGQKRYEKLKTIDQLVYFQH